MSSVISAPQNGLSDYDPDRIVNCNEKLLLYALRSNLRVTQEGKDIIYAITNPRASYAKAGWALIRFSSLMKRMGFGSCITKDLHDRSRRIPPETIEQMGRSMQDFFNNLTAMSLIDSYTNSESI